MPDFGTRLSRVGAALQGNLPQFDETIRRGQRDQFDADQARQKLADKTQQTLGKERKEAAAADLFKTRGFLERGDAIEAVSLLNNRVDMIGQLGGDPSDTMGLLNQIQSGDINGALAGITEDLQIAESQGFFKLPEQSQQKTQIVDGQVVAIGPDGQGTATPIEGFVKSPTAQGRPQIIDGQAITTDPETGQVVANPVQGFRRDTGGGKAQDRNLRERQLQISENRENRLSNQLSSGLEKALLVSQDRVVEAQRDASTFDALATDFDRLKLGGGLKTTFSETIKRLVGGQDEVSDFRRQFNQIRISQGLRNLPPGTASDADVKMAMEGLPPENANAKRISSFLRGVATLARFDAGYNQFKADFIGNTSSGRGLNQAWRGKVNSPKLGRGVVVSEIYAAAQSRGSTPEQVMKDFGITEELF